MTVQQLFLISALVPIVTVLVLILVRYLEPLGLRLARPLVPLRHAEPRLRSVTNTAESTPGVPGAPVPRNGRQGWHPSSNNPPPRLCSS